MKAYKTITILTILFLITILGVISFLGFYKVKDYKVQNIIPDYVFGKEFSKSRVIEFTVDEFATETKIYDKDGNEVTEQEDGVEYTEANGYKTVQTELNSAEAMNKDNYKKAKNIIKERLKKLDADEYSVKLNEENGTITVDMAESEKADKIISVLTAKGTFELQDSETKEVLIDSSNIKSVKSFTVSADASRLVLYLQINFNKEGKKKLEDISKVYIETKSTKVNEDGTEEEETESKEVSILIDGEEIRTTHFGETLTNGVLNIPIAAGATTNDIKDGAEKAKEYCIILNSGVMPLVYEQTNSVKDNSINIFNNKTVVYSVSAVILVAFLFLVIRLKLKGLLATAIEIGYVSLLLLALRYANVKITILGAIGIGISILINYYYTYKAFKNIDLDFIKDTTKKIALVLIPLYVLAIVFTFSSVGTISSLGMTLAWGMIIMYLYSLCITQIAIKTIKE